MNSLVLIRHGQSLKNQEASKYEQETKIPFKWEVYSQDPYFLKRVSYSLKLIDCSLSQKGVNDCLRSKQSLIGFIPDLILVSPLERALQSCKIIFPATRAIVEPLLTETVKHTSQISKSIQGKKHRYQLYDFSELEKQGQFWFLKNDVQRQHQQTFNNIVSDSQTNYIQKTVKIAQIFEKYKLKESWKSVRKRCQKMKEKLKEYKKTYQNICIVSHFFIIQVLTSKSFDQQGKPNDPLNFKNGQTLNINLNEFCEK